MHFQFTGGSSQAGDAARLAKRRKLQGSTPKALLPAGAQQALNNLPDVVPRVLCHAVHAAACCARCAMLCTLGLLRYMHAAACCACCAVLGTLGLLC